MRVEEMTLEDLAKLIGPGFHPDTPPEDYTNFPESITFEEYNAILDDAWDADDGTLSMCVYTRAYLALNGQD